MCQNLASAVRETGMKVQCKLETATTIMETQQNGGGRIAIKRYKKTQVKKKRYRLRKWQQRKRPESKTKSKKTENRKCKTKTGRVIIGKTYSEQKQVGLQEKPYIDEKNKGELI